MTHLVFNYEISINADQQKVFDYVSDFTKHGEWTDGLRMEAVSDGPVAVGSEYKSIGKQMGKDIQNDVKITAYNAPSRISFLATDAKGFPFHGGITLEPQGDHTLLKRHVEVDLNPVMAIMFKALIGPLVAHPSMNKTLRNLKAQLES
ncbi:MAG: hypothetical protein BZY79_00615 [SAR202 cluster bacterium Casp-Chloro-G4]|nr:SRPBCC family protein [Chloroflexota bacterium]MDA1228148.1 SRPBCC family protein [Chloroflexota bacterium]PKB62041.1 MAG: hypothetical protein BZY79_00615 [SAR202 cluster bacterium Casp-Chloro-G4]